MKKYRVLRNETGNISECHALGKEGIPILTDEYGNQLYGYDEEKDEFFLIPETIEIKEQKRKINIINEIHKNYSIDDEIVLIKKAINSMMTGTQIPEDYIKMENRIFNIKYENRL